MGAQAWLMDDSEDDQRLEHHRNPPEFVSEEFLKKHGVLYWNIDPANYEKDEVYAKIKSERGYNYEDQITCSREKLPNYDEKLKMFFQEHLHLDEEVRYCVDGSGYFDFRDYKERWVRIKFSKGDLFVLPAGIYHRFTLDTNNFVVAKRLFIGEPIWTPYNRPADEKAERIAYVESIKNISED